MKRFFSRLKDTSHICAKSRLKSVIDSDRAKADENVTMEKIRKDVTAVLLKYSKKENADLSISVTCDCLSHLNLTATMSLQK